jgi:hypothetical protein
MKGKIFVAVAVVAVAVMAGGAANAACNPSKEFALAYYGTDKFINFAVTDNQDTTGSIIGRVWGAGARATTGDAPGLCDDQSYILDGGPNQKTIFGSNGADLGTGTCDTGCWTTPLILLVQTKSLDGSTASYVVGKSAEFSGPNFDFSRADGGDWNMIQIPKPNVTASSRTATDVTVDVSLDPPTNAVRTAAADAFPAPSVISGYQLVTAAGGADPGREQALWVPVPGQTTVPTSAGPSTRGGVVLACPAGTSIWIANRPVFDNGQFSGDYVSAGVRIACANVATPGSPNKKPKPILNQKSVSN